MILYNHDTSIYLLRKVIMLNIDFNKSQVSIQAEQG